MSEIQAPAAEVTHSIVRRCRRFVLLVAGLGFALLCFALTPLYVRFGSDIAYADTWWVNVLYYLTNEGLWEILVFALCYPATAYAVWVVGLKRSMSIPVWYSALTLAKFLLNFTMTSITDSALPDVDEFLSADLPIIVGMFALEMLQYILVLAMATFVRWRHNTHSRIAEGMKLLPKEQRIDYAPPAPAFPFVRLISFRNPLQRVSFFSALLIFLGRFGMHMIYQITLFIRFGSSDGWVYMLIDLISDLALSVVVYFIFLLLFNRFHERESEKADR